MQRERVAWLALGALGVAWLILMGAWTLDEHFATRKDFERMEITMRELRAEVREIHNELRVVRRQTSQ